MFSELWTTRTALWTWLSPWFTPSEMIALMKLSSVGDRSPSSSTQGVGSKIKLSAGSRLDGSCHRMDQRNQREPEVVPQTLFGKICHLVYDRYAGRPTFWNNQSTKLSQSPQVLDGCHRVCCNPEVHGHWLLVLPAFAQEEQRKDLISWGSWVAKLQGVGNSHSIKKLSLDVLGK